MPRYDTPTKFKRYQGAFNAWSRCNDPDHPRFKDYGGRGIKVLFLTVHHFAAYLLTLPGWDDLRMVIDRIDNNDHYREGNLRFATRSESIKNRRRSRPIVSANTVNGQLRAANGLTQSDVARATGLSRIQVRRFERGCHVGPVSRRVLAEYYRGLYKSE